MYDLSSLLKITNELIDSFLFFTRIADLYIELNSEDACVFLSISFRDQSRIWLARALLRWNEAWLEYIANNFLTLMFILLLYMDTVKY